MGDGASSAQVAKSVGPAEGAKKGADEPVETDGLIGKAQNYDGVDDEVNFGTNVPATESAYTISLRRKASAAGG